MIKKFGEITIIQSSDLIDTEQQSTERRISVRSRRVNSFFVGKLRERNCEKTERRQSEISVDKL